jgi:hypothetical protein
MVDDLGIAHDILCIYWGLSSPMVFLGLKAQGSNKIIADPAFP